MCGVRGAVSCWFFPERSEAAVPLLWTGSQDQNAAQGREGTSHLHYDSPDINESAFFVSHCLTSSCSKSDFVMVVFLITFGLQLHAEIQFELLEGAALALATLNGLNVQGQTIKVTPPVVFCAFQSR